MSGVWRSPSKGDARESACFVSLYEEGSVAGRRRFPRRRDHRKNLWTPTVRHGCHAAAYDRRGNPGGPSGGTHAERTTCAPAEAIQEKGRGPPWGHAGAGQARDRHGQVQAERALDSHASEVRIALGTRTITGGSKDVDRALAWPQYCTPEKSTSASPALWQIARHSRGCATRSSSQRKEETAWKGSTSEP